MMKLTVVALTLALGTGAFAQDGKGWGRNRREKAEKQEQSQEKVQEQKKEQTKAVEVKGRDVVKGGKIASISGTLKLVDGHEWALVCDDQTYALHLGPSDYRDGKGLVLKEGKGASVTGFVLGVDVAPCSVTAGEKTVEFRNKEGRPAWAGKGKGRNKK